MKALRRLAVWLVALSLLPAGWLVLERVASEGRERRVLIVMDELALAEQAAYLGTTSLELGLRYRDLGLAGIALYEDTLETLARKGAIVALLGSELRALAVATGERPPPIPADATAIAELVAGAADGARAKNRPAAQAVDVAGRTWWWWPGESLRTRPAGPDRGQVAAWVDAGFAIAYRPRNFPNLQGVGTDFPDEAGVLIHAGLQVAGHPNAMDALAVASEGRLTALIEGTPQDGLVDLARRVPTARLLSFNQDYQNQRLRPDDLIDKYLLAANERNIRVLYVRPYTEEQLGDMVANTEALVSGLYAELARENFEVGPIAPPDVAYVPASWARVGAALGIVAGLFLLATAFPGPWGALVASLVVGLAVLAGGLEWAALALVAALVFPVLGYALLPWRPWALVGATGVSLVGSALLAAVGSDRAAMLGLEPFAGVAATLVVPPALFAAIVLFRERRPAAWVRLVWSHPLRLGEVAVALVVVTALGLAVLRRGNFPIVGASEIELALRSALSDLFVRPRFKELLGHPLALLALLQVRWPWWARGGLLVAGVVAQASVLNSFSHYHTPLLVSLQRTVIALVLAAAAGLLLWPLVRLTERAVRTWLGGER